MPGGEDAVGIARTLLRVRRARSDALPHDLFTDVPWDVLLEAFVAAASGISVTGQEIARRCDIPPSVLGRWIKHLCREGLLEGSQAEALDRHVLLTDATKAKLERLLVTSNNMSA